jgi:hypothetical protein
MLNDLFSAGPRKLVVDKAKVTLTPA